MERKPVLAAPFTPNLQSSCSKHFSLQQRSVSAVQDLLHEAESWTGQQSTAQLLVSSPSWQIRSPQKFPTSTTSFVFLLLPIIVALTQHDLKQ